MPKSADPLWGGGGGNFLYMAKYGCACQIAPFFSAARYMIGPLFSTKSIWMARFFWIPILKAPFFWHPGICTYFFAQRFFEAAYPLSITWIDCDICVTTSKKWVQKKKSKGSIWIGHHFGWSSIWMCPFFQRPGYEWGRFWNTGSHTRKFYPPPPPPPPAPEADPNQTASRCLSQFAQIP